MKHYSDETVAVLISNLLRRLDEAYGEGMHWYGQTPDWYVCAAMVICNIEDKSDEATAIILEEAKQYETLYSST